MSPDDVGSSVSELSVAHTDKLQDLRIIVLKKGKVFLKLLVHRFPRITAFSRLSPPLIFVVKSSSIRTAVT